MGTAGLEAKGGTYVLWDGKTDLESVCVFLTVHVVLKEVLFRLVSAAPDDFHLVPVQVRIAAFPVGA